MRRAPALVVVLALALTGALAACGDDEEDPAGTEAASTQAATTAPATTAETATAEEPTETTAPEPTSEATPTTVEEPGTTSAAEGEGEPVAIYLVRQEKVAPVRRHVDPGAPARGALEALLEAPGPEDEDRGTAIPDGTRLLDVAVDDAGVLTVDLSGEYASGGGTLSMRLRLAQVVYTATQFPTVTGVSFRIDGEPITALGGEGILVDEPQTRADYEDETPLILVEEPLANDVVTCPVRARGTSNVFEATSQMAVSDAADLTTLPAMAERTIVTATSGTGTRGTFDVEVPCTPPPPDEFHYLISWWDSAKDGSPQDVEYIPLGFE